MQDIGDRRQTAVQDDVAGFSQRFLLQIDDILQGMLVADDRADQFEALRFRKNQQRPAGKWPFKGLLHRDELLRVVALDQFRRRLAGYDLDGRDRQQDLLADHLSQAVGGAADPHVGDFGERILLNLGELVRISIVMAPLSSDEAWRPKEMRQGPHPSRALG